MIFSVLLVIALLIVIGLCFIKSFNLMPSFPIMTRVSYSYGIGIGLVSFQMLIYSYLNIEYNPFNLLSPWLIFIVYSVINSTKKIKFNNHIHLDSISKIIVTGILLTISYVIFEALIRPLSAWDAWATWFIGAKAFYLEHKIDPNFYTYAHFSVQPAIMLVLTFTFTLMGQVNDQSTLILFTSFYLFLLIMIYSAIRKHTSLRMSLLFVFLFSTLGNVIRHAGRYDVGYVDLPLGYFFFASFLLLDQLKERFSNNLLILLNFLLAVTALIKSEGLAYFLIVQLYVLYLLFKQKKLILILYSGISLILVASWPVYLALNHIPQTTLSLFTNHLFIERIPIIVSMIFIEFFNIQRWNLLWLTFFVCLIIARYNKTLTLLA